MCALISALTVSPEEILVNSLDEIMVEPVLALLHVEPVFVGHTS